MATAVGLCFFDNVNARTAICHPRINVNPSLFQKTLYK